MDKELKKEIIIKSIKEMEDGEHLNFLFGFIIQYNRNEIKGKENENEK